MGGAEWKDWGLWHTKGPRGGILLFHQIAMSKPTEPYDPQTLDHYESFHKEIDRNGYLHIIGYSAVFAPFGWFIGTRNVGCM
mgnify:CR=1 FL=1